MLPRLSEPPGRTFTVYGSRLSPFTLKVMALLRMNDLPARLLPAEGSLFENLSLQLRKEALVSGLLPLSWPAMNEDDEYPLVPFIFTGRQNLYDSSALAAWLEMKGLCAAGTSLYGPGPAGLDLAVRLVDEYADEFGLYMAHHNRWVHSAMDTRAEEILSNELSRLLPGPLSAAIAARFACRQVSRLPYLFSVAPPGPAGAALKQNTLPACRQPPSLPGFLSTHALLEESFIRLLDALEAVYSHGGWLFGSRFSLADASLYGQLGMNLDDLSTAGLIRERAPAVYNMINSLHQVATASFDKAGSFVRKIRQNRGSQDGAFEITQQHRALFDEIFRTWGALMNQNEKAVMRFKKEGHTVFNEKAFNRNRCLYDGRLDGVGFKAAAKTFQARTWRRLKQAWQTLDDTERRRLEEVLPQNHGL